MAAPAPAAPKSPPARPAGNHQHKCTTCDMSFRKLEHAQRHERTHSGARPYSCTSCGKTFARQDTLNRHAKLHDRPDSRAPVRKERKKGSKDGESSTSPSRKKQAVKLHVEDVDAGLNQDWSSQARRMSESSESSNGPMGMKASEFVNAMAQYQSLRNLTGLSTPAPSHFGLSGLPARVDGLSFPGGGTSIDDFEPVIESLLGHHLLPHGSDSELSASSPASSAYSYSGASTSSSSFSSHFSIEHGDNMCLPPLDGQSLPYPTPPFDQSPPLHGDLPHASTSGYIASDAPFDISAYLQAHHMDVAEPQQQQQQQHQPNPQLDFDVAALMEASMPPRTHGGTPLSIERYLQAFSQSNQRTTLGLDLGHENLTFPPSSRNADGSFSAFHLTPSASPAADQLPTTSAEMSEFGNLDFVALLDAAISSSAAATSSSMTTAMPLPAPPLHHQSSSSTTITKSSFAGAHQRSDSYVSARDGDDRDSHVAKRQHITIGTEAPAKALQYPIVDSTGPENLLFDAYFRRRAEARRETVQMPAAAQAPSKLPSAPAFYIPA